MNDMTMPRRGFETEPPTTNPPPPPAFTFRLGQCVTHKDQPMPSLVLMQHRTGKNGDVEIYGVRSFMAVDPNRDRIMLGEVLRHVTLGSADCQECLLYKTGLCPR